MAAERDFFMRSPSRSLAYEGAVGTSSQDNMQLRMQNRLCISVRPKRPRSGPGCPIFVLRDVEDASEIGGHGPDCSGPERGAASLQMPVRRWVYKQRIA